MDVTLRRSTRSTKKTVGETVEVKTNVSPKMSAKMSLKSKERKTLDPKPQQAPSTRRSKRLLKAEPLQQETLQDIKTQVKKAKLVKQSKRPSNAKTRGWLEPFVDEEDNVFFGKITDNEVKRKFKNIEKEAALLKKKTKTVHETLVENHVKEIVSDKQETVLPSVLTAQAEAVAPKDPQNDEVHPALKEVKDDIAETLPQEHEMQETNNQEEAIKTEIEKNNISEGTASKQQEVSMIQQDKPVDSVDVPKSRMEEDMEVSDEQSMEAAETQLQDQTSINDSETIGLLNEAHGDVQSSENEERSQIQEKIQEKVVKEEAVPSEIPDNPGEDDTKLNVDQESVLLEKKEDTPTDVINEGVTDDDPTDFSQQDSVSPSEVKESTSSDIMTANEAAAEEETSKETIQSMEEKPEEQEASFLLPKEGTSKETLQSMEEKPEEEVAFLHAKDETRETESMMAEMPFADASLRCEDNNTTTMLPIDVSVRTMTAEKDSLSKLIEEVLGDDVFEMSVPQTLQSEAVDTSVHKATFSQMTPQVNHDNTPEPAVAQCKEHSIVHEKDSASQDMLNETGTSFTVNRIQMEETCYQMQQNSQGQISTSMQSSILHEKASQNQNLDSSKVVESSDIILGDSLLDSLSEPEEEEAPPKKDATFEVIDDSSSLDIPKDSPKDSGLLHSNTDLEKKDHLPKDCSEAEKSLHRTLNETQEFALLEAEILATPEPVVKKAKMMTSISRIPRLLQSPARRSMRVNTPVKGTPVAVEQPQATQRLATPSLNAMELSFLAGKGRKSTKPVTQSPLKDSPLVNTSDITNASDMKLLDLTLFHGNENRASSLGLLTNDIMDATLHARPSIAVPSRLHSEEGRPSSLGLMEELLEFSALNPTFNDN